jgi:predicted metalloprotease with PDZ domain
MLHYKIYLKNPQSHYIYVDLTITEISESQIQLQLPAWRPGRYELGNFAKNIKKFEVFDAQQQSLSFHKLTKDKWVINTNGQQEVKVTYSYYTSEINAGNCYADETQIYVNPVHLCFYQVDKMNQKHQVEVIVPENFNIICTLNKFNNLYIANSFDELADSPIIASSYLKSDFYVVNGVKFGLHFNGECQPDFEKIKVDFIKFTQTQLNFFETFPFEEYHFMFQILPFKFYHGVEHLKSTVIAIGPGYAINSGSVYEDVLGVSSHELFHAWNVKSIRPKEMLPYDFTKENYAKTGFVYEGFTTYYGDLILLSSGVFSEQQYFNTLEERLVKHFHNYGRFNLSVADSSFDTWLDGYVPGAPYRKTSIYDEGNLIALMLDVNIMKGSNNQFGLKHVCRELYLQFAKKEIGYEMNDIIKLCSKYVGNDLSDFFNQFVLGTSDYLQPLKESFEYLGLELKFSPSLLINESKYGFKTIDNGLTKKVSLIAPYSPAWHAGLSIGDEIIGVNDMAIKGDLTQWMYYFENQNIELNIISSQQIKKIGLSAKNNVPETYFDTINITKIDDNINNFQAWLTLNK